MNKSLQQHVPSQALKNLSSSQRIDLFVAAKKIIIARNNPSKVNLIKSMVGRFSLTVDLQEEKMNYHNWIKALAAKNEKAISYLAAMESCLANNAK